MTVHNQLVNKSQPLSLCMVKNLWFYSALWSNEMKLKILLFLVFLRLELFETAVSRFVIHLVKWKVGYYIRKIQFMSVWVIGERHNCNKFSSQWFGLIYAQSSGCIAYRQTLSYSYAHISYLERWPPYGIFEFCHFMIV